MYYNFFCNPKQSEQKKTTASLAFQSLVYYLLPEYAFTYLYLNFRLISIKIIIHTYETIEQGILAPSHLKKTKRLIFSLFRMDIIALPKQNKKFSNQQLIRTIQSPCHQRFPESGVVK